MKIAKNLNLIIPVRTEKGNGWIHATPISKEVFKEHFLILGKTFSAMFSDGLGVVAGPRVAFLMLEKISCDSGIWEGDKGVRNTLVNEIIRLANLVYPVEGKGYDTIPLDMALEREIIDLDEVAGELVFFTCVSSINSPEQAKGTMDVVNGIWSTQCSSLNLTEWIASLPTLKSAASSGATANTSSATSSTTQPEPDSETSVQIPV
ncbi:hypothetical protein AH775_12910 [Salmonella enterica subsp. enterica serovar Give]|uniref:Uncharacterized protein n=1 Tax=Salmonella typhimurium (strain SL1344) TaxID=216597 RepID=A0A718Y0Q1_SALTS|nr:hypothetical protein [Salmonella enterica]ECI2790726.1 hypothetical protein [Salmonella enterica subsp. enterica serovar Give]EDS4115544.1 hypothetical protein [Salmonella enterica subsp. enterica serovar Braenderup]EGZ3889989.1 hypothetical protein [Salmonella enterica subsp. enterica serovar Bonn]EHA9277918.1 hypothetical protein [Salmonella enterica subsp. enterica serovar Shubra]HAD6862621.1 hypothetical protein [Salmonella enterica subsp. enterica serovar Typhimurium str. SL1344]